MDTDSAETLKIPKHIAIIMDGNGRWAQKRDQPRIFGHLQGAKILPDLLSEAYEMGVQAMTLYSFSWENWKRPAEEVEFIMSLAVEQLQSERQRMLEKQIRFVHVGSKEGLPQRLVDELNVTTEATAQFNGPTLLLALNYGARHELAEATKAIAQKVAAGEMSLDDIQDETLGEHLYTTGVPEPDLLIRTGGDQRLSNFLLWQVSYTELYFTQTLWPDFSIKTLHEAIREFSNRHRRFGGLNA